MSDFRGSKAWDYRLNPALGMCFADYSMDHARADVRTRALTVLRHFMEGESVDLEGPGSWQPARLARNTKAF